MRKKKKEKEDRKGGKRPYSYIGMMDVVPTIIAHDEKRQKRNACARCTGLRKLKKIVWKKVEEYLRLFETYGGNRFSLFLMSGLGKLMLFSGRMTLRMKLIAKKELNFLFQMAPSRILWDQ